MKEYKMSKEISDGIRFAIAGDQDFITDSNIVEKLMNELINVGMELHAVDSSDDVYRIIARLYYIHFLAYDREQVSAFIHNIISERRRQNELYNNVELSIEGWTLIIIEEYGELVRAFNNYYLNDESSVKCYMYEEMVQVCALLVRYLEEYISRDAINSVCGD